MTKWWMTPLDTMVKIRQLQVDYRRENGQAFSAIRDVNLDLPRGGRLCIVGPSGCGKTTLLLAIAGLLPPSCGSIEVDGYPVTGPRKDVSVILQNYGLFPWKTVCDNVSLPLKLQKAESSEKVNALLASLGLADKGKEYPDKLSGGERQRVAIARALISDPALLLMDEALSALDFAVREQLEELLLSLCRERGTSLVLVTHDLDEAVFLGEYIMAFTPGNPTPRLMENTAAGCSRDSIEFADMRARLRREIRGESV